MLPYLNRYGEARLSNPVYAGKPPSGGFFIYTGHAILTYGNQGAIFGVSILGVRFLKTKLKLWCHALIALPDIAPDGIDLSSRGVKVLGDIL